MNRLTKKDKTGYTLTEYYGTLTTGVKLAFNKLGKVEDIEEQIGISIVDFIKLTKAEKIYLPRFKAYYEVVGIDLKTWEVHCRNTRKTPASHMVKIRNYGRTWTFKKGGDDE